MQQMQPHYSNLILPTARIVDNLSPMARADFESLLHASSYPADTILFTEREPASGLYFATIAGMDEWTTPTLQKEARYNCLARARQDSVPMSSHQASLTRLPQLANEVFQQVTFRAQGGSIVATRVLPNT